MVPDVSILWNDPSELPNAIHSNASSSTVHSYPHSTFASKASNNIPQGYSTPRPHQLSHRLQNGPLQSTSDMAHQRMLPINNPPNFGFHQAASVPQQHFPVNSNHVDKAQTLQSQNLSTQGVIQAMAGHMVPRSVSMHMVPQSRQGHITAQSIQGQMTPQSKQGHQ